MGPMFQRVSTCFFNRAGIEYPFAFALRKRRRVRQRVQLRCFEIAMHLDGGANDWMAMNWRANSLEGVA